MPDNDPAAPGVTLDSILPQDFEGRDEFVAQYKNDPLKVIKNLRDSQSQLGRAIIPPADGDDEEKRERFRRRLRELTGVPESPDEYRSLTEQEGSPQLRQLLDQLKQDAHEAGVPPQAWERLVTKAAEANRTQAKAIVDKINQFAESQNEKLRQELGDNYDKIVGSAQRAFEQITKDEPHIREIMDLTGLSSSQFLVNLMAKVYKITGNDRIVEIDEGGAESAMTDVNEAVKTIMDGHKKLRESGATGPERAKLLKEISRAQQLLHEKGYRGVTDPRLNDDADAFEGAIQ